MEHDHISLTCGACQKAMQRIAILERELEQAALRFESMHKTCTMLPGMALIGGENCRTRLSTPNK